jgi:hypothetical protein
MKKTFLAVMSVLYLGSAGAIAPVPPHANAPIAAVNAELHGRGVDARTNGLYQAILNLGIDPARFLTAANRGLNVSVKMVADLIDVASDPAGLIGMPNIISVAAITPVDEAAQDTAERSLQAAANLLAEKKRGEKDTKLDGIRLIYRSSHSVFTAFDAALRLFTTATLEQAAQAAGNLNAALVNVVNDITAIQDQIDGTNGGVGLSDVGRTTAAGRGAIADGAQQLHDDLAVLHNTLLTACTNIVTKSVANGTMQDHETLAVLALIGNLRLWNESTRNNPNFNRDDVLLHFKKIGLPPASINEVKRSFNESVRRLHAGGNIPPRFIAANPLNAADVTEYIIP